MSMRAIPKAAAALAALILTAMAGGAWAQAAKPPPAAGGSVAGGQGAAPTQHLTLADVIARYVAWRGGAAFERLQSIRQDAYHDPPGGRQTIETWLARDGRSRVVTEFGPGVQRVAAAGPGGAFVTNVSGQVLDDPDAAASRPATASPRSTASR